MIYGTIIANKIFITGTNTEITNTVDLSKLRDKYEIYVENSN